MTVRRMPGQHEPPKLLTYADIARLTGLSVGRLRHLKCEGNFPKTCGPGRRVLVHPDDFTLWLDRNRRAA